MQTRLQETLELINSFGADGTCAVWVLWICSRQRLPAKHLCPAKWHDCTVRVRVRPRLVTVLLRPSNSSPPGTKDHTTLSGSVAWRNTKKNVVHLTGLSGERQQFASSGQSFRTCDWCDCQVKGEVTSVGFPLGLCRPAAASDQRLKGMLQALQGLCHAAAAAGHPAINLWHRVSSDWSWGATKYCKDIILCRVELCLPLLAPSN